MADRPVYRYLAGVFLVNALLWLLLSGIYTPLLLFFGLVSCLLVVWVALRMQIADKEAIPIHLVAHLPRMAWELLKAILESNRDVALLLLRGGRDTEPTVRTIDFAARQSLTQAAMGNAITLTPGTLTMGVADGRMTIHALTPDMLEGLEDTAMIRTFRELDDA